MSSNDLASPDPLLHAERKAVDAHGARQKWLLERAEQLIQMGSGTLDLRTSEAVWSEGMYRIHGFEPGAVVPSARTLVEHVHPDDRERVSALLATIARTPAQIPEQGLTAEYRVAHRDGSVRSLRFHGRVEHEGGEPAHWVVAVQDVTEERWRERELQAHYAVSQALRDWQSFDEGVVGLLRRLGTALDFPIGLLWIPDRTGERLVARAFWTAPDIDAAAFESATRSASYAPGEGVAGRVWSTGLPIVVEDVRDALRLDRRSAASELGLRSAIAFGAAGDGGSLAVLSFYSFDRRATSERLVRTLTGIGHELGRFLNHRRAELGTRRLSTRELQVLRLAAEGNTGPDIAERLFLSPATVKTHFQHIYEKLGVGDRAAAVAHALRIGLIR
jgi:PAS domain S-box-containing protein